MNYPHQLSKFITKENIDKQVARIAQQIQSECEGQIPVFLCVLHGAFVFASDLIRRYNGPCEISFISISSYEGTQSSGKIYQNTPLPSNIKGRSVIIIEDIVDTGLTMSYLTEELKKAGASQVKIAALFNKPSRRETNVQIDYFGFEIENRFIVGYGLDYNKIYRNLPEIYIVENP